MPIELQALTFGLLVGSPLGYFGMLSCRYYLKYAALSVFFAVMVGATFGDAIIIYVSSLYAGQVVDLLKVHLDLLKIISGGGLLFIAAALLTLQILHLRKDTPIDEGAAPKKLLPLGGFAFLLTLFNLGHWAAILALMPLWGEIHKLPPMTIQVYYLLGAFLTWMFLLCFLTIAKKKGVPTKKIVLALGFLSPLVLFTIGVNIFYLSL